MNSILGNSVQPSFTFCFDFFFEGIYLCFGHHDSFMHISCSSMLHLLSNTYVLPVEESPQVL